VTVSLQLDVVTAAADANDVEAVDDDDVFCFDIFALYDVGVDFVRQNKAALTLRAYTRVYARSVNAA